MRWLPKRLGERQHALRARGRSSCALDDGDDGLVGHGSLHRARNVRGGSKDTRIGALSRRSCRKRMRRQPATALPSPLRWTALQAARQSLRTIASTLPGARVQRRPGCGARTTSSVQNLPSRIFRIGADDRCRDAPSGSRQAGRRSRPRRTGTAPSPTAAWSPVLSVGTTLSSIAWKIDGHAGHDMDVADPEARRHRDGIVDMLGAARHARHALARLGELDVALGVAAPQAASGLGVVFARHAERLGDRSRP